MGYKLKKIPNINAINYNTGKKFIAVKTKQIAQDFQILLLTVLKVYACENQKSLFAATASV